VSVSEDILVFLCHSSGDKERVRQLYHQLTADGVRCWFDEEDLLPGQDWESEIGKAIRRSRFVLACISNSSISKSGFVQKELRLALDVAGEQPDDSTFLIPVRLEQCEIPDRLKRWQAADLFKPKTYETLRRALRPEKGAPRPEMGAPRPKKSGSASEPPPYLPREFSSWTWYRTGLERCRAVARVETGSDEAVATGFLVAGPDLHPDLPPIVLMTAGAGVPGTVHPAAALLAFRGLAEDQGSSVRFRVIQQWWYQPSAARGLDTTILELDGYPEAVDPLPLAKALPPKPLRNQGAYIIGHPGGVARPQFSLHDNILLDYDERFLHYRTSTDAGSAGSPVFNEAWDLIGLHHARGTVPRLNKARGTYAAGEGITIDAIRRSLAEQPPEGPRHY
jgi:TIR domain/Trypsin-like peptidase domain